MITDDYERCWQRKLPSMPSHERKLYSLMIPTKNHAEIQTMPRYDPRVWYWMARWMPDEFGSGDKEELRSGTWERRKWVDRISELGTEESNQLGIPFFCLFSSLLFSILFYIFGSRPSTNGVGTGFYHLRITAKWRWSFPVRGIRRKVTLSNTNRLWDLWVRMVTYAA